MLLEKLEIFLFLVLKNHRVWFPYFALGLQKIALELIQSDTQKNLNIRLTQGRLQETNNQIGFLGRRIFVEVAVLNVQSLDQQLLLLINAVFASSSLSSIAYVLIDVILELTVSFFLREFFIQKTTLNKVLDKSTSFTS